MIFLEAQNTSDASRKASLLETTKSNQLQLTATKKGEFQL